MDRRLARRRLADAALKHVPDDHFLDRGDVDPGAAHRLADHEGAEPGGGQRGQAAKILADGRTTGAQDDSGRVIGSDHPSFRPTPDLRPGLVEPTPRASAGIGW